MKIRLFFPFVAVISVLLADLLTGCTSGAVKNNEKTPLVVFAAGSLIIPFDHLEKGFEARYPNIDVQAEYHGSIQVIRHATELHKPIDVIATADASLLPMLMYSSIDPDTGKPYADWYIRFAGNRLAIAYQPQSAYAEDITSENWYEILSRPDVKVGLADPRFDAVGYRALMSYALAGQKYSRPTIFTDMFNNQFTFPLGIFSDGQITTVTVPEILETRSDSHILVRGASVELIALLEAGEIDYAFEYESVIHQHGLSMLKLPPELNLGEADYHEYYSQVQVDEDFQRFSSVKPIFRGERIGYGITIPENASHPEEAELFIAYLLSPEGRSIMAGDSHEMFDPVICDQPEQIPATLLDACQDRKTE